MSNLGRALIEALDDEDLDALAERLGPRLPRAQANTVSEWLRGAAEIAEYISAPASRVYALVSAGRLPIYRDGSALIARRSELDAWLVNGGSKRP